MLLVSFSNLSKIINQITFFFRISVDPYSPWSTLPSAFRLNNINTKSFTFTSENHSFEIAVSANATQPHLVDLEVRKDGESIKKFTAVDSHFDKEGLLISRIDNKKVKSNVVLYKDDVVVFDGVCYLVHK